MTKKKGRGRERRDGGKMVGENVWPAQKQKGVVIPKKKRKKRKIKKKDSYSCWMAAGAYIMGR